MKYDEKIQSRMNYIKEDMCSIAGWYSAKVIELDNILVRIEIIEKELKKLKDELHQR